MYRLLIFLALVSAAATRSREKRIVDGDKVKIEDYPYQVSVQIARKHTCGGTIITSEHILTAAHCANKWPPNLITVRVGSTSSSYGGTRYKIKCYKVCEEYNVGTLKCDVAILALQGPILFSTSIRPIPLATEQEKPKPGEMLTVTGWGLTKIGEGSLPESLRAARLPAVDLSACACRYKNSRYSIIDTMICAGDGEAKGTLQGDSGGPLVNENKHLVGVASWGYPSGPVFGYPDVYADVTNPRVRKFIEENAWPAMYYQEIL